MNRELQILFEKAASLLFEMEAFVDAPDGRVLRRPAGSGIFVAPCQALTARHVVTDMHNVNPARADHVRRHTHGYALLPYHGSASQIFDLSNPSVSADWGLTNVWANPVTDIAILQFAPIDDRARQMMDRMRPLFPKWSLLPPPAGTVVTICGQPRDAPTAGSMPADTLTYVCQPAVVVENFEKRIDRGMYNFPCYTVDREVPHGMSGGPVFWDGRLCGIVSGGLGTHTVIASLWPVCLTEFENPKLGALNSPTTFEALLDTRQIDAVDWNRVKGNVSHATEDGRPVALLRPPG